MEETKAAMPTYSKPQLTTVGELLKNSYALIQKRGKLFAQLMAAPLVLVLAISYASTAIISKYGLEGLFAPKNIIIFGLVSSIVYLVLIVISIIVQASIYLVVKNPDQAVGFKEALMNGKKVSWQFFLVSVAIGIFVMLWSLLLIIPGIAMAVAYSFALWAYLDNDFKGTSSLKRSKELVKDYWWPVFGRYAALYAIFILIMIVMSMLMKIGNNVVLQLVWTAVNQVISMAMGVFGIIYSYLLYQDLVKIKGESKVVDKSGHTGALIIVFVIFVILFGLGMASSFSTALRMSRQMGMNGANYNFDMDSFENNTVVMAYQIQQALDNYKNDYEEYPNQLSDVTKEYSEYLPKGVDLGDFDYTNKGEDYKLCFDLDEAFLIYPEGENCFTGADYSAE